jgi:predicted acyl esterase
MYDHQFQAGVPYFLQYTGPQAGYPLLSIVRDLPAKIDTGTFLGTTGQNFGNEPTATGCGLSGSALLAGSGQVTGQYEKWHAVRDWSKAATAAPIPVFLVHGVNDGQVRIPAMKWFADRAGREGDKAWIGQWGHTVGDDTSRGLQWTYALLGWFDKQLKGKRINTGPSAEVFLNNARTLEDARLNKGDREVLVAKRFPVAKPSLRLFPSSSGGLADKVSAPGSQAFAGDPLGFGLGPLANDVGPMESGTGRNGHLMWATAPMRSDLVLAGIPELALSASVTTPQVYLIANLLDRAPDGTTRRISHFSINPLLRSGVDTVTPVIPGEVMRLRPPGFAIAQRVARGHALVLQIATSDPDKVPLTSVDPLVTVFTGPGATELRLPVVSAPRIADDVPRG